ncbi:hypothetical protein Bca52824_073916 [Brassica carinata]|uniref:Uncharacterized protein n=1 Tax=Brassica carinata TaxID=52824 RepID=A0A8X7U5P1_BRACI|nr:hypothetical protein Bca52824_073916 [Brassica carinata]
MLSGAVKQRLTEVLTEVVERHRKARAAVTNEMVDAFMAFVYIVPFVCVLTEAHMWVSSPKLRRTTVPDRSTGKEDPTVFWLMKIRLFHCHVSFKPLCKELLINLHRLNTLQHLFKTGSMYAVSGFDITRSNLSFKLSDSPLSMRLGDLTAFFQITTPIPVELAVANKTDEAVFVSFDGVITKLTNIGAAESGHIHHQTFTISRIFNEPNCPPVPDFFVDGGTGGPLNDMSGASSLTTKVCAVLTVDDNEPPGETIAGGVSATDFLIPTSSKPTRKARLD